MGRLAVGPLLSGLRPAPRIQGQEVGNAWGRRPYQVPLSVLRGSADTTVAPVNGEQVHGHWRFARQAYQSVQALTESTLSSEEGGQRSSVRKTQDALGVLAEFWPVQGMGHRWPGGTLGEAPPTPRSQRQAEGSPNAGRRC